MAASTIEDSKLPGGYLVTPRVPQGLAAAVEGLTREVIRHSPEDIYVFAAHHFEKLLLLREQCGDEEMSSNRESNLRTLREMSKALRMREIEGENARLTKNKSDQVGWSLNQTAKVLKRHRSIFGEAGGRISTDEVFQMANQKENHLGNSKQAVEKKSNRSQKQEKKSRSYQTADELWKASTSKNQRAWSNDDSTTDLTTETKSGPRIITQISSLQNSTGLLAKDIKTELRRNRISSRERRNVRAKPEERSGVERTEAKLGGKSSGRHSGPRKSSERPRRMESDVEKRNRRSYESTKSSKDRESNKDSSKSRAVSMDRVKNYVVERFASTKSLEELQSVNYVEKVQEIIDDTGPIIKGKVDELKSGIIGRSKRSSWFGDSRNDRSASSNDSQSENRGNGDIFRYNDSMENRISGSNADALRNRLTETQNLLENVSSKLTRTRRSRSARSSRISINNDDILGGKDSNNDNSNCDNGLEKRLSKTKNLLEDISSTLSRPIRRASSAKNLRRYDDDDDDDDDFGTKDALKTRLNETRNLLEGISASLANPGHRVGSTKGRRSKTGGNIIGEDICFSDSQSISNVSLPAVKSASAKSSAGSISRSDSDVLVLPAISPEVPKSKRIKENLVLPALSPPGSGTSNEDSKVDEEIDVFKEENIAEFLNEDFIPEAIVEDIFRDSLNVTPDFDSIPQRPDSLEPPETAEDNEDKVGNLEERLQDIQKVGKNIEEIFSKKNTENLENSDKDSGMKKKLQELEEAEKRIERIFFNEAENDNEDSTKSQTNADVIIDDVDGLDGSGRNVEEETTIKDGREENGKQGDEEMRDDEERRDNLLVASPESLNYTYVLTEGSPYDIPDTVTTVIIPERNIESPESDRLDILLEDDMDANLSLISAGEMKDAEIIDGKVVEDIQEKIGEEIEDTKIIVDTKCDVSHQSDTNSPNDENMEKKNEDVSSPRMNSDLFGELVEHEPIESNSPDIDFIRDLKSRQEIHISHQDLGRINEEISEELEEGLEEHDEENKRLEAMEAVEEIKEEGVEEVAVNSDDLIAENEKEDNEERKKIEEEEEDIKEATNSPDGSTTEEKKEDTKVEDEEAIKTAETIEITDEIKESDTEDAASNPDGEISEKEKEDNVDIQVEVEEVIERTKTVETLEEIEKEDTEEVPNSRDSSTTKEKKEDNEDRKVEDEEAIKTEATEEIKEEDTKESFGSPDSSNVNDEKKDHEDKNLESDEAIKNPEAIEKMEENKDEDTEEAASSPDGLGLEKEENEIEKFGIDKSKSRTESDFSPEASRPDIDSESSNEAKESSGPEEFGKCVNSADEEDSSDTRSPESSNEVKETTLTDGLSLSIDPMRPFVPELNLDSLQDLTVSSFKMTEDDYENQGHVGSGNTNSIAETLTSDENRRINENSEFNEEAIIEYVVSSSERSKIVDADEVVEEPIVKSRVEVKEDICRKSSAYVTGPETNDESSKNLNSNLEEIRSEEKEEMEKEEVDEKEEIRAAIDEDKQLEDPIVVEKIVNEEVQEEKEEMEAENPQGHEKDEVAEDEDGESNEDKSEGKPASFEEKKKEEIKDDDSGSLVAPIVDDFQGENHQVQGQMTKEPLSGDLSGEIQSIGEGSDEILEENFVEEDTPLAVSRSASQCTTRRVSSGNLAKLREDPTHGWTEETEQENGNADDTSLGKLKFSKIGGETIKEQGSDEIDQSQDLESSKNVSVTKDSREYHIYVPEVDASEDNTTTESSTVDSAVTKIQARVRGFLTRRRIHRGQQNRSSTLSSIPSIQDSIAVDPRHIDVEQHDSQEQNGRTEEPKISSSMTLDDPGLENAATRIQSNYRGYKARKRLRREDAVQRTTLSLEKSFAESGLQHTGEFHDCIPLPIHDMELKTIIPNPIDHNDSPISCKSASSSSETKEMNSNDIEDSQKCNEENREVSENLGKMFFGQSTVPVIQFGMNPNIGQLVDLVVLAKDEAALEKSYLNFITSVEDAEAIDPGITKIGTVIADENVSNESLKEPLALSATPVGVVIEEVTSSDFERFLNNRSSESTIVATESSDSAKAPCASSETISESTEGPKIEVFQGNEIEETSEIRQSSSGDDNNLVLPAESLMIENVEIPEGFSLPEEIDLLGPESSVDSMECPVVRSEDKTSSRSSGGKDENSEVTGNVGVVSEEEKITDQPKDSTSGSEDTKENVKDELISNVEDPSSTLSFSLKVEDILGLGSEDSMEIHGKKPILEVTLTPGDIMKSMSLSQESQLAGERIQSPITMVQMAPGRSESLQTGESGCEDEETNGKAISPVSAKSEHK